MQLSELENNLICDLHLLPLTFKFDTEKFRVCPKSGPVSINILCLIRMNLVQQAITSARILHTIFQTDDCKQ